MQQETGLRTNVLLRVNAVKDIPRVSNRGNAKRWLKQSIAGCLAAVSLIGCGGTREAWRAKRPPAAAFVQPQLPAFHTTSLTNGVRILTAPMPQLPIVDLRLVIKVGSAHDQTDQGGTAYLMGKMLQESTRKRDSLQLARAFADLGSPVNVHTTQDEISISVGVQSRTVDKAAGLLAEMLQQPAFTQDDFARVKTKHLASLRKRQAQPAALATATFMAQAYGKAHPYGHPVMGTLDSVQQVQREDVVRLWQKTVGPRTTALIFSGDVTPGQAQQLAHKHVSSWSNPVRVTQPPADPPLPQRLTIHVIPRPSAPQTFVMMGRPLLRAGESHSAALAILNALLGGMFSSRLNLTLREEKGWTYGAQSSVQAMVGQGPLLLHASIQKPHGADAIREMAHQLSQLQKHGPESKEVTTAKQSLLRSFAGGFETVGSTGRFLMWLFVHDLPLSYHKQWLKRIKAVTTEEVAKLAGNALQKHHMHAVAVGDPVDLQPSLFHIEDADIIVHNKGTAKK